MITMGILIREKITMITMGILPYQGKITMITMGILPYQGKNHHGHHWDPPLSGIKPAW
jgi:hypothetical protein